MHYREDGVTGLRAECVQLASWPGGLLAGSGRFVSKLGQQISSWRVSPRLEFGLGQILAWRNPLQALEHRREGGRAFVAKIERDGGDRFAGGEAWHGGKQAGLLPPGRETQSGLLAERPRERAAAHAELGAPAIDRVARLRLLQERVTACGEALVLRKRQAERQLRQL